MMVHAGLASPGYLLQQRVGIIYLGVLSEFFFIIIFFIFFIIDFIPGAENQDTRKSSCLFFVASQPFKMFLTYIIIFTKLLLLAIHCSFLYIIECYFHSMNE